MKREFSGLASALALLGTPALASDPYIVPDAVTPWVFEGVAFFSKGGPVLNCIAQIEISGPNDRNDTSPAFDHSDVSNLSATITFSGGPVGLCGTVTVDPILAGNVSYSGGAFTFHDVTIYTTSSSCVGDITGTLDDSVSPASLAISGTLPGIFSPACELVGGLELVSPGSGNAVESGDWDYDPNHP